MTSSNWTKSQAGSVDAEWPSDEIVEPARFDGHAHRRVRRHAIVCLASDWASCRLSYGAHQPSWEPDLQTKDHCQALELCEAAFPRNEAEFRWRQFRKEAGELIGVPAVWRGVERVANALLRSESGQLTAYEVGELLRESGGLKVPARPAPLRESITEREGAKAVQAAARRADAKTLAKAIRHAEAGRHADALHALRLSPVTLGPVVSPVGLVALLRLERAERDDKTTRPNPVRETAAGTMQERCLDPNCRCRLVN